MRKFLYISWLIVTISFLMSSYFVWQNRSLPSDQNVDESEDYGINDYWTEERMEEAEAEAVDMPVDNGWTTLQSTLRLLFPYLLGAFILFTACLLWYEKRKRYT